MYFLMINQNLLKVKLLLDIITVLFLMMFYKTIQIWISQIDLCIVMIYKKASLMEIIPEIQVQQINYKKVFDVVIQTFKQILINQINNYNKYIYIIIKEIHYKLMNKIIKIL